MADGLEALAMPATATGGLPGAAADLGDIPIAPAPDAASVLRTAAYGDQGAANYDQLAQANQMAQFAAPAAPAAAPTGGMPSTSPADPIAAGLAGFATSNPAAGRQMYMQRVQMQAAMAQMQQREQSMAINDATFVEKLQNEPLNVRADMIQAYALKQGRTLTPAESNYIAQIDPSHLEHTRMLAANGDVTALANLKALFGGNPIDMVTAKDDILKRSMEADKSVSEAMRARTEAEYAAPKAESALRNQALEAAERVRTLQRPPTPPEIQELYAGGLEAYKVPIPGSPNGFMWSTRPLTKAPQVGESANAPTGVLRGPEVARAIEESKKLPAMQQRIITQIGTALAPINKLEGMLASNDPKVQDAVKRMGPQWMLPAGLSPTGAAHPVPFSQDTEGTSHDSITHPWNASWYNYKMGGSNMTPEERELMATLGTVSASGWQGLTSGIRNRAVIEDVKQHIPRPWDSPDLVKSKIDWIRQWYQQIKASAVEGSQTLRDLADENAGNPINVGSAAGAPSAAAGQPVRVTTRAEVDALPPGTPFINPADGRTLYKK